MNKIDADISKMFKDKNKEIFLNSLTLEMERNLETLKNTTDNCVALEINKLFLFFKKYFQEIDIKYKKEELLGILYRERKKINDIINDKIEEKKKRIKENFLEKVEEIDDDFLNQYSAELSSETNRINNEIELELKKEIRTEFSMYVTSKYKLKTIEQDERIHSRIDILFNESVISRIKEQTIFRDDSLKNMAKESYNKYIELNKRTT